MLRFPLKSFISFLSDGKFFIGRVVHAGDNIIKIVDLAERIMTPDGEIIYTDNILGGVWHFDRKRITGFRSLSVEDLYDDEKEYTNNIIKTYKDVIIEAKRQQFRIIKKVLTNPETTGVENGQ